MGPQQTAAAEMVTTILSLPHAGAVSLFQLSWAPPLEAQAGQRKSGSTSHSVAPEDPCLPVSGGLCSPRHWPWLRPGEKPASQHDSHIPSGWNAFIWPRPSPVGSD